MCQNNILTFPNNGEMIRFRQYGKEWYWAQVVLELHQMALLVQID